MYKFSKKIFPLLLVFSISPQIGFSEIIHNELAVEAVEFQYNLIGENSGNIVASQCEKCPPIRLNISSKTKAFAGGKLVSLSSVPTASNVVVTVIYDPKTMNAHKIIW